MNHEPVEFEDDGEVALEPQPPFAEEGGYLASVRLLPAPSPRQIENFVRFAGGAKSWYKHLPVRPPGGPMCFFLDANAGRDRLRRRGHRVLYRDRTAQTEKLHYSWMTTEEYRRRFGYLSFCCPYGSSIWMDEKIEGEIWTRDPNFTEPLIETQAGRLARVPESVLHAGTCWLTRTVHERTDAARLRKGWPRAAKELDAVAEPLSGFWSRIATVCEELATVTARHAPALEAELTELVEKQRGRDHAAMKAAVETMLAFVH